MQIRIDYKLQNGLHYATTDSLGYYIAECSSKSFPEAREKLIRRVELNLKEHMFLLPASEVVEVKGNIAIYGEPDKSKITNVLLYKENAFWLTIKSGNGYEVIPENWGLHNGFDHLNNALSYISNFDTEVKVERT